MIENTNRHKELTQPRIVVILAGGRGSRMGGIDKGDIVLGAHRLVDHVINRLTLQAERLLLSSAHNYGTSLTNIPDVSDGPLGPAAGLLSATKWFKENYPDQKFFITAPVDGPFLPSDLVNRLLALDRTACAKDSLGDHPTFACWEITVLERALSACPIGKGVSLREILRACKADTVTFPTDNLFLNINNQAELSRADSLLECPEK